MRMKIRRAAMKEYFRAAKRIAKEMKKSCPRISTLAHVSRPANPMATILSGSGFSRSPNLKLNMGRRSLPKSSPPPPPSPLKNPFGCCCWSCSFCLASLVIGSALLLLLLLLPSAAKIRNLDGDSRGRICVLKRIEGKVRGFENENERIVGQINGD
ncbi:hypothetical protein HS088_TW21G01596 [Tripterygium wilfordii]|uniref:Transmembrane protein n=1 Tax=Tripterygium wilfordii TaxID=458696 RepID=A0A7J7C5N2_TRIWF|nr:hypothetical protein HS088_TW21G01596 [Tripterygium wilfordii]